MYCKKQNAQSKSIAKNINFTVYLHYLIFCSQSDFEGPYSSNKQNSIVRILSAFECDKNQICHLSYTNIIYV